MATILSANKFSTKHGAVHIRYTFVSVGVTFRGRPGNKTNSLVNCFLSVSGNKAN